MPRATPSTNLRILTRWTDAARPLDELAVTVWNDIAPLLETRGAAPHSVIRQVLSYVDYLGALYVGTTRIGTDRVRTKGGVPEVGFRFKRYLRDCMTMEDKGYGNYADVLYNMFRNGTVHEFDPKNLKLSSGESLRWLVYRGPRRDTFKAAAWTRAIRHLRPFRNPVNKLLCYFPVSTICLTQDLLFSVEHYKTGLGDPKDLVRRWNETARILNKPTPVNHSASDLNIR